MREKHDGRKVEFEMKVVKSHQHNSLGRQCHESVVIKNTEPSRRINNKEEYHQPGDVQIEYKKNINEKFVKKKLANRLENRKVNEENNDSRMENQKTKEVVKKKPPVEINISDFLKEMRRKAEAKAANKNRDEEDPMPATQEMIEDARDRRTLKKNGKSYHECEMCPYKSESKSMIIRHMKTHQSTSIQDKVGKSKNNDNTETRNMEAIAQFNSQTCEQSHQNKTETKMNKKVSKRIKCEKCEQKFNKKERFEDHMKKVHKEGCS